MSVYALRLSPFSFGPKQTNSPTSRVGLKWLIQQNCLNWNLKLVSKSNWNELVIRKGENILDPLGRVMCTMENEIAPKGIVRSHYGRQWFNTGRTEKTEMLRAKWLQDVSTIKPKEWYLQCHSDDQVSVGFTWDIHDVNDAYIFESVGPLSISTKSCIVHEQLSSWVDMVRVSMLNTSNNLTFMA